MTDLAKTIIAKSDQLNADDLIAGPITVTITDVRGLDSADQPIAISYEGDGGKPYKPCKSMRRVMVGCWGPDGKTYAGKRMTLFCDPNVQFGGIKVGGIRISHVSHIDRERELPLNVTRGKKALYKVRPLRADVRQGPTSQRRPDDDFPGDRRPAEGQSHDASAGGFGAPTEAEELTVAARWARQAQEDLEAGAFDTVAKIDGFMKSPDAFEQFTALQSDDPNAAKRLEAAFNGRRKALADRERQG